MFKKFILVLKIYIKFATSISLSRSIFFYLYFFMHDINKLSFQKRHILLNIIDCN